MTYKEKLIKWNATDKYRSELNFLLGLIGDGEGGRILDFGCGIMTAIKFFSLKTNHFICGYDVEEYGEQQDYHLYDKELNLKYDVIYFMHSLAHIKKPVEALTALHTNLVRGGRIIIITPNKEWLDEGYIGDETVVKHYSISELYDLLKYAGYEVQQSGQFGELKKNVHERLFLIAK